MKKNFHALGKRALALLVSLTMCVSLLQVTAFAALSENVETAGEQQVVKQPENETPGELSNQPAEETPGEPPNQPAEETPDEPSNQPAEETPDESSNQPAEETPGEPSNQPAEETPGEPSNQPAEETPGEPSSQPVDNEAVSQGKPVVVTKPAAPPAHVLTTPAGAISYIVNALTTYKVGDKCPECQKGIVVEDKSNPNHLICDSCAGFSFTIQGTEPEPEKCKHEHGYDDNDQCPDCKALNPNHKHSYDETGKCVCGDQHKHTWTYEADVWKEFTHVKYCAGCGEKKTESCTKEKVYDPWAGQYIYKCTLCNYWWEPLSVDVTHHWSGKWEPDPQNKGSHIQTCTDTTADGEACKEVLRDDCKPEIMPDGKVVCPTCGWVQFDDGKPGDIIGDCEHEYGNVYQHGEGSHWQVCNKCHGKSESEKCNFILMFEENTNIAKAYVCPVCGNTKTTEKVPVCDPNDPTKGHNWQVNRTELALDGETQLVIVKCANCGAEKVDGKCNSTEGLYKLTVRFVKASGEEIAKPVSNCYAKDAYYKVECPKILGYTPDEDVVYGNMPAKDTVINVVYRAGFTLKIDYVYDDTNEVFSTYTETLNDGAEYKVTSPDMTNKGYALAAGEQDAVKSGKINGESVYYHVDYKLINYTWTIQYVDENDDKLLKQEVYPYTAKTVGDLPMLSKDLTDLPGYVVKDVKGDEKPTADKLHSAITQVVCGQESRTYTLTIDYIIDGQSEPFATHVETLANGATYNVESPDKTSEGYALAAGQEDAVKSGTITGESVYYHVDYKPITYTWTINYVDENGNPMDGMKPHTQTFDVNSIKTLGNVTSPTQNGYTADKSVVLAPTELGNITDTVKYSLSNEFKLTTIHRYLNRDGSVNHEEPVVVENYKIGDQYTTSVRNETGYTFSKILGDANGVFGAQDVTVVYEYNANAPTGGGGGGTPPVNPNPPVGPDDPIEVPDDPNVPLEPGPGTDDPQEPGPGDDVIIDDPNVPLAPGPDIPDVDIDDPDVPMTNKPTAPAEKNPVPQPTATGLTEIEDEDVPLAEVPQTGDNTGLWIAAAILAACGLVTLGKKREDA